MNILLTEFLRYGTILVTKIRSVSSSNEGFQKHNRHRSILQMHVTNLVPGCYFVNAAAHTLVKDY